MSILLIMSMRKPLSLLMLVFLPALFFAQGKMRSDSLWKVWNNTSLHDTDRIKAIHQLAWKIVFADPDSAYKLAGLEADLSRKTHNERYLANAYNTMGVTFINRSQLDSALKYDLMSYELRRKNGEKRGQAVSLNNIGIVYYQKGDYRTAVDYYQQSLRIKEEIGDVAGVASAYGNIGLVYEELGNMQSALKNYCRSLQIRDSANDLRGTADAYGRLGSFFEQNHQWDSAKYYLDRSLNAFARTEDLKGYANTLSDLGEYFLHDSLLDTAFTYFNKAYLIRLRSNDRDGIAKSLTTMGEIANRKHDYRKGEEYCVQALQISDEIGYPGQQVTACNCLADAYEGQGKYKDALIMARRSKIITDSLSNDEKSKAITRKELEYDYQKRMLSDSLRLADENRVKDLQRQSESRQQRTYLIAISVILVFMAFIIFILFRNAKHKQKANALLEEKNRHIEEQKAIVEDKQKQIIDSIEYAKRIQQSLLPSDKFLSRKLDRREKER